MRARSRHGAALKEYRKAESQAGDGHLGIQTGIAATLLELKQPKEVPSVLKRVLLYYPTHLNSYLYLGEALMNLEQPHKAIKAFEEAVGINPFHPLPHHALVKLYEQTNNPILKTREQKILEMLTQ